MKTTDFLRGDRRPAPLWLWVGLRMSALAVGTVIVIAFGMWLYFNIVDSLTLRQMSPQERQEIEQLRDEPGRNEARLWQLFEQHYNIKRILPGLSNPDWLMLVAMVATAVPLIIVLGLVASRPLSRQFTLVIQAAHRVRDGDFTARVQVVPGAPNELSGLAANFNDMTTRLQQYEREVRDSSAMLAHELRTPLNAAMGRIQGMLDEVFPFDPEQLQSVHRQLEQINRLVGDLHLVSLARAGQLILELGDFALRDLIAERLEWVEPRLQEAGITTTWPSSNEIRLYADRARIGQLLTILIDNVLRYAATGKTLEVEVQRCSAEVVIVVNDRGPGVPSEQVPNMVDRFWRAERSRARHWGGSGLGLAIASAICQSHGGSLACSNRSGGGMSVAARLPIRAEEGADQWVQ